MSTKKNSGLKHFGNCTSFLKEAWKFSNNLTQCLACNEFSIINYKIDGAGGFLDDESRSMLDKVCDELNKLSPSTCDMFGLDIHLSHGYCGDCLKEKMKPIVRRRQIKEGNFPCFATAIGDCDQKLCKYYSACVA